MKGFLFSKYNDNNTEQDKFEQLLSIFKELLLYTSGDTTEALDWLNQLDREYKLTDANYGMGDFIEDLKRRGYLNENNGNGNLTVGARMEQTLRSSALEEIFGKLKKGKKGNHNTPYTGGIGEVSADMRAFQFGDSLANLALTETLKNATGNALGPNFSLTENDMVVREMEHQTATSTVLMIDISHSMILYGEDRITPAKKVALGLAELIKRKYPKDNLDVVVFGNDAWEIKVKDIPYLNVGPYHTNTVAGLQLARNLLRRRKNPNKQIFMITDGKPTCLKEGAHYYQNSFGLDRKIVNKTLNEAAQCRRLKIPITTFMIASDPYLQSFVEEFTEANNGKAFYADLTGLGKYVFHDYQANKRKSI